MRVRLLNVKIDPIPLQAKISTLAKEVGLDMSKSLEHNRTDAGPLATAYAAFLHQVGYIL